MSDPLNTVLVEPALGVGFMLNLYEGRRWEATVWVATYQEMSQEIAQWVDLGTHSRTGLRERERV